MREIFRFDQKVDAPPRLQVEFLRLLTYHSDIEARKPRLDLNLHICRPDSENRMRTPRIFPQALGY